MSAGEVLGFAEFPELVIQLYTRESAPHGMVVDAYSHRHQWNLDAALKRFEEHAQDPGDEKKRAYPCAACDWNDHAVKKARAKKLARVREFARSKRLPAGWMKGAQPVRFGGARMSDEEAARIVLPRFPVWSAEKLEDQTLSGEAVPLYLEAMGEKRKKLVVEKKGEPHYEWEQKVQIWSCGCKTGKDSEETEPLVEACKRHRGALQGRDESTGEWL